MIIKYSILFDFITLWFTSNNELFVVLFVFVNSIGRGVVGLVVKPITGALDAASSVTEGVASTARSLDDKKDIERVRLPRMVIINEIK